MMPSPSWVGCGFGDKRNGLTTDSRMIILELEFLSI